MANNCFSEVYVTGEKKELDILYRAMCGEDKTEYVGGWLGDIVKALGGSTEKVCCKGEYSEVNYNKAEGHIYFMTVSAWAEPYEVFAFVKSVLPSLKFFYMAEEGGCGYYVTNDKDQMFFDEGFFVISVEEADEKYFNTKEQAKEYAEMLVGRKIDDSENLDDVLSEWAEKSDKGFAQFYEYEFSERYTEYELPK